jgi:hypothetical protein
MTLGQTIARVVSLLIAGVYGVIIVQAMMHYYPVPAQAALRSCEWCAVTLVPVLLIWFPEPIGAATGYLGNGGETPAGFVAFLGWVFLLGVPGVIWLVNPG